MDPSTLMHGCLHPRPLPPRAYTTTHFPWSAWAPLVDPAAWVAGPKPPGPAARMALDADGGCTLTVEAPGIPPSRLSVDAVAAGTTATTAAAGGTAGAAAVAVATTDGGVAAVTSPETASLTVSVLAADGGGAAAPAWTATWALPPGADVGAATARHGHGVLTVTVPGRGKGGGKPLRITIGGGGGASAPDADASAASAAL